jgi:hypothetical protein
MGKELINHTASKFSSNKGGVNQNHLHHLHHASTNVVLLATVITREPVWCRLRNKNSGVKLYNNYSEVKKPYVIINPKDVLNTINSYTFSNHM